MLGASYQGLENPRKTYTFLCSIQQGLLKIPPGSGSGQCGSTGILPLPDGGVAPPPPPADPVLPAAPTGVTATAGNASVTVSWSAVSGADSYTVKVSTATGGPYGTAAAGVTGTSYAHSGLTNGNTYFYVVSATNGAGEGPNSSEVFATPVAPPPVPTGLSIWWPTDGAALSGTHPFKARLEEKSLKEYKMYWQVDGGQLNRMYDSYVDGAHKEAQVDVTTWNWRGNGPYVVNFVAKTRSGTLIEQKSVSIFVAR